MRLVTIATGPIYHNHPSFPGRTIVRACYKGALEVFRVEYELFSEAGRKKYHLLEEFPLWRFAGDEAVALKNAMYAFVLQLNGDISNESALASPEVQLECLHGILSA